MSADTIQCPACGVSIADDSSRCRYCGTALATVACPSCFGRAFVGSKFCSHCGAELAWPDNQPQLAYHCPRCRTELAEATVGVTLLHQCAACSGIWVDTRTFDRIYSDNERQAVILGSLESAQRYIPPDAGQRRYLPCPQCSQLMNKTNFARCSGVLIDVCKRHGTWFDHDELRRLIEFIRDGGVDRARRHERETLEAERRRLESLQFMKQMLDAGRE